MYVLIYVYFLWLLICFRLWWASFCAFYLAFNWFEWKYFILFYCAYFDCVRYWFHLRAILISIEFMGWVLFNFVPPFIRHFWCAFLSDIFCFWLFFRGKKGFSNGPISHIEDVIILHISCNLVVISACVVGLFVILYSEKEKGKKNFIFICLTTS